MKAWLHTLGWIAAACMFEACPPSPTPDPVPTPRPPATCTDACANASKLGCPFAQPTKEGDTCVVVCENAQVIERWDLGCRAQAASCEAYDACPAN